jgi:hypothetical protein
MKGLEFLYKGKERRLFERHAVSWDALLEAKFPDCHGHIDVKIVNISTGGALLRSEHIRVENRHLVVTETKPDLALKITLPEMLLNITARIAWYKVLNDRHLFEIGLHFIDFNKESNVPVERLVKIMEAQSEGHP